MSELPPADATGFRAEVRRVTDKVSPRLHSRLKRLRRDPTRKLHGVLLDLDGSWATSSIREAIDAGWYEEPERLLLDGTLRPDDRYLELGAGIGFIATRACQLIGDDRVVAYEAVPELAAVATETTRRNGFQPAIFNAILGEEDGEADLFVANDFWASTTITTRGGRKIRVPVRSFGSELARTQTTYLMVDIEGGELDLLGATELPWHVRAVCIELHPHFVGATAIQRLLVKLINDGFQLDLARSLGWVAFLSRDTQQPMSEDVASQLAPATS